MSVDKFGRSNNLNTLSGDGMSLSYIKKNFGRKNEVETLKNKINILERTLEKMKLKHYITLWAEERGGLIFGKTEFSFGDGLTRRGGGYTVLTISKILKMGLSVSSKGDTPDEAGVTLLINGMRKTGCKILKPAGKYSHVIDTPETMLKPGEVINFISDATTNNIQGAVVSLLLEISI